MNLFHPRTVSTDWEVIVVDRLERLVGHDKLMAFAGYLRNVFDVPVNTDWNALEFALGINHSFDQLWNRVRQVTDRATQIIREFDLDLCPMGAHPLEYPFWGAHIHVGTIHDESAALLLENQMLKYTPAFAALATNSAVAAPGRRGEFKSYRVSEQAWGCSVPATIRDPHLSQNSWGNDASAKLYGAPTMEVRIGDCASSRRFLAEYAIFVAAFVHHLGTRDLEQRLTPRDYQDCMTNRWSASRHGLQATFLWEGRPRPVVEVLSEMLDQCAEELGVLGVQRSALGLIERMLEKRVGQADYMIALAERYPDPYCLASVATKLLRHWDVFDQYLETTPALEPVPLPDEEAILAAHLARIGEETHFYRSREAMYYPPPLADAMIERLVEKGMIRRDVVEDRGVLLSRTG
jgi:gamma-glutamyl:cysteine ligase YbdK (ATP-grasp superfamily)